jgi:hypothetical protein
MSSLSLRSITQRARARSIRCAAIAVLTALAIGAPVTAVHAASDSVDEPTPGVLNQWGGKDRFCKPFRTSTDADRAVLYLRSVLLPFLSVKVGHASRDLYEKFLQGGPNEARSPEQVTDRAALEQFRTDQMTTAGVVELLSQLQDEVIAEKPVLSAPSNPTTRSLTDFEVGQNANINWHKPLTIPGNIAGGVGEVIIDTHHFPDLRNFSGALQLIPEATNRGVLRKVTLRITSLTLDVVDAIDFCPGDQGSALEQNFTIPLSRLEMTPLDTPPVSNRQRGFYGRKIRFAVEVKFWRTFGTDRDANVTRAYETNDGDGDGVPNRQPWSAASYTLDNCPDVSNANQADKDRDGRGNACDDEHPAEGASYGDPHMISFDGATFDFQATGEYVLAKSTTDDFEVHARFARSAAYGRRISWNHSVAARVGASIIAFGDDAAEPLGAPRHATLDGQALELTPGQHKLPGGAVLIVETGVGDLRGILPGGAQPRVRWPDGTELLPTTYFGRSTLLRLAPSRRGHVEGVLGDADGEVAGDLRSRDGVAVTDVTDRQQLYGMFARSWRVDVSAAMFRIALPTRLTVPVEPVDVLTLSDLTAAERDAAEKICRSHGLLPGAGLEQCILDVVVTGDERFAAVVAEVADRLSESIDYGAIGAPVEDARPLDWRDENASGTLSTPRHADVFTVTLQDGDSVGISTLGVCSSHGSFSVTLIDPSGRVIDRTHGDDDACEARMASISVKESGTYQLRVFDSGGFTGDYEFQLYEV